MSLAVDGLIFFKYFARNPLEHNCQINSTLSFFYSGKNKIPENISLNLLQSSVGNKLKCSYSFEEFGMIFRKQKMKYKSVWSLLLFRK